jgi:HPt (histidine-containing phosphotransfer) domain-containing protein
LFEINQPVLDADAVLDRVGGDEELLREIIAIFLEEYPLLMAEIRVAVSRSDRANLERAAHSLKGAVSNFGARTATDLARDLEAVGRTGELGGLAPIVSKLDLELASLQRALAGLQGTPVNPERAELMRRFQGTR